jgi:hypothetical protein
MDKEENGFKSPTPLTQDTYPTLMYMVYLPGEVPTILTNTVLLFISMPEPEMAYPHPKSNITLTPNSNIISTLIFSRSKFLTLLLGRLRNKWLISKLVVS